MNAVPSPLKFPQPELPAPGKFIEVADGVFWLRMPLPFALDHINLWLLRDGAGWTIVDSGYGIETTQKLWDEIFRIIGNRIVRIIVTHFHPDHVGLAGWLSQRFNAPVWMTQAEFLSAQIVWETFGNTPQNSMEDLFRRNGLDESRCNALAVRGNAYRKGVPTLPPTFRRIVGDDNIMIDGRAWRVIIGRGHSPEHAALYCDSVNVLISGDMLLPKISTNVSVTSMEPDGNPLKLFMDSLRAFNALPPDTLVLPSHGNVFTGLHKRVEQLLQHHEERFALLLAACSEPRSAAELLNDLFKRELDTHQLQFAMGEAIAHLNYLMYAERLKRSADKNGILRFVRT